MKQAKTDAEFKKFLAITRLIKDKLPPKRIDELNELANKAYAMNIERLDLTIDEIIDIVLTQE